MKIHRGSWVGFALLKGGLGRRPGLQKEGETRELSWGQLKGKPRHTPSCEEGKISEAEGADHESRSKERSKKTGD